MIPASPGSIIGPGLRLDLNAGLSAPPTSATTWDVEMFSGEPQIRFWSERFQSQANPVRFIPWVNQFSTALEQQGSSPASGKDVQVAATVQLEGGGPADATGTANFTWDTSAGIPAVIDANSGGSGLSTEQAQQLTDVHGSTFVDQLLDKVTLTDLAPGPPTGLPVNAALPQLVFGVIVRLATIPEALVPITPDGDYWLSTLAVIRVFRGSDLWLRIPVHTSSKLASFWTENLLVGLTAITSTQWLLNMTVQVTFLPGVTGKVFLMNFP